MKIRKLSAVLMTLAAIFLIAAEAGAALSITPSTWNIIGLDSNDVNSGPNRFPVGAKVCSDTAVTDIVVTLTWDSANAFIDLRAGSLNPITIPSIAAGGCKDAFFEVEVQRNVAAYETTRRYHITATGSGTVSTPTPRELYVERLISQYRNSISDVRLDGVSIPSGGGMNLVVGSTYTIELRGGTATQGYSQFEKFINFSNTIFRIVSVSTSYSADDSPYVSNPNLGLYADACLWENDPNSPFYRSCIGGDYKSGGSNVVTTYTVEIVGGGGTSETLTSLLYDFSGASYHYNADYSTGARYSNIIDPTTVNISKSFTPDPTNVGGVSTLTFTLSNPNAGAVSGVNFTDTFPTSPGNMVVATPPDAATNGCGTPTFSPVAGAGSVSFSGGTIAANSSCTVKVSVTPPATGTYNNTSELLYVGTTNTGKTASDSLTVNTNPPAPPPVCGQVMAQWTFTGATAPNPAPSSKAADVATATATFNTGATGGTDSIDNTNGSPAAPSWKGGNFQKVYTITNPPTSSTAPYYELSVDSSKYTNVTITVNDYASSNWGTNNALYVWASADGGAYAATTPATGALVKQNWTANLSFAAASTGATTTQTFRIGAAGSTNNNSQISLDNITVTGCAIPNPPTITKAFSPNPVAVGATSTLTFTVVNPNAGVALTGVAFSDTLPSGLTVADGSSAQCGGTLTTTSPIAISFSGGTIAATASCNITATVTATTAGPHDNVSGFVSSTEGGTNTDASGIASASLTAVSPPGIAKQFAPNPILSGGVSTLTFTITNPNQNNALGGVGFTDTFPVAPGNMVVAPTPNPTTSGCGSPTFSPVAGAGSISFSGGTVAAGGTCYVTVDVTAPAAGTYNNTSGNVSHVINAATVSGNTASGSLTVKAANPGISFLKQVGLGGVGDPWKSFLAIAAGGNVYYKLTIENTGDVPLSPVSVSDPDISGEESCTWTDPLPVADAADSDHITTCTVGPITAVAGSHPNTATGSGTYGGSPYTDQSSATYATTGLTMDKTATQTHFTAVGNVLNYNYSVTNSGYIALKGPASVSDDKAADEACPAMTTVGDLDNYLDQSETITCTATYTIVAADATAKQVTNIASATVDGVTSANDTLTVPMSSFTVVKSVVTYSDPINGTTSPKAIPGSEMVYTIQVVNTGLIGAGTIVVTDPLSTDAEFFAGDINGAGSGPVRFIDGTGALASGLSYSFVSLSDGTDGIQFSDQSDCSTSITPTVVDEYAPGVKCIKISPSGTFSASDGTNNPFFELKFQVRVK